LRFSLFNVSFFLFIPLFVRFFAYHNETPSHKKLEKRQITGNSALY
jgi:hypothetical protein